MRILLTLLLVILPWASSIAEGEPAGMDPAIDESGVEDAGGDAPELPDDDAVWTPWDTAVVDEADIGWKGQWKLSSATLFAPHGSIQFPSAGHTLTVDYFGNFIFDYAPAYFLASTHVSSNVFTGEHPLVPPAGALPPGVPSSCAGRSEFSGRIVGKMIADGVADFDRVRPDGSALFVDPWLKVSLDQSASEKPSLTCDGAEVQVRSTGTILPLGAGRPTMLPSGPVVEYDYEMDVDLTRFKITSRSQPKIQYIFVK